MGVLQNRLNDAVLEVLTTMLYRNPACRLYPDDVRFIQPVGGDVDFTSQVIYLILFKHLSKLLCNIYTF